MISLKKYLDQKHEAPTQKAAIAPLPEAMSAYRAALKQMGECSSELCPAPGERLRRELARCCQFLPAEPTADAIQAAQSEVEEQLRDFSRGASRHFQQQTAELKEMLVAMAKSAEAVGERDQRCTRQMQELTSRLQSAAKLEDLTQIRAFIVRSAAEIKSSIDKMAAEGKAAVEMLRREVSAYQSKLEEAEQAASRDSLTQLHCRSWVEGQIERRIAAGTSFCVALLDLDGFKQLNDDYGHLFGDEVLKQFSAELKSACRSSDPVGRWGGDEFLIILDCRLEDAAAQTDRLCQWVCGNYTIPSPDGPRKITINASIGVAEFVPGESMQQLLARADSEMYRDKRSHKDAPLPEAPSMLADHLRTGAAAHSR